MYGWRVLLVCGLYQSFVMRKAFLGKIEVTKNEKHHKKQQNQPLGLLLTFRAGIRSRHKPAELKADLLDGLKVQFSRVCECSCSVSIASWFPLCEVLSPWDCSRLFLSSGCRSALVQNALALFPS
jgi:hypothetical protein